MSDQSNNNSALERYLQKNTSESTSQTTVSSSRSNPSLNLNINSQAQTAFIPASFTRRWVAPLVDGIIVSVMQTIVSLPTEFILRLFFADPSAAGKLTTTGTVISSLVGLTLWMLAVYFYYGHFYSQSGATPGIALLGLKVIDSDTGTYISRKRAIHREVFGKLLSTITLGIGFFMALFTKDNKALHDKMFDTRVIRVEKKFEKKV